MLIFFDSTDRITPMFVVRQTVGMQHLSHHSQVVDGQHAGATGEFSTPRTSRHDCPNLIAAFTFRFVHRGIGDAEQFREHFLDRLGMDSR